MLETPHVALGIALATKLDYPLAAISLSLASHFLLDKVPHWNPHFYTETAKYGKPKKTSVYIAIADEILAVSLTMYTAYHFRADTSKLWLILLCALFSILPDQIKLPYFFFNKRKGFIKKWVDFEKSMQIEIKPFWGIITQVAVIFFSIIWIFTP